MCVAENAKSRPMAAVSVWLRGQDLSGHATIHNRLIFSDNIFHFQVTPLIVPQFLLGLM
jgi:hypothetical protein